MWFDINRLADRLAAASTRLATNLPSTAAVVVIDPHAWSSRALEPGQERSCRPGVAKKLNPKLNAVAVNVCRRRLPAGIMAAMIFVSSRSGERVHATVAGMLLSCLLLVPMTAPAAARTVYRCVLDGTVSLATAPEPDSVCEAHEVDDEDPRTPNLWGAMGEFSGALYAWDLDGRTVYSTRELPESTRVLNFSVRTPPGSPAHPGLGTVGRPRLELFDAQFRAAARTHGVDESWLRAIAHAESYFDANAVSDKGAMGVMQLMPDVVADYAVTDPFSAEQSIVAGARHLRFLLDHYEGDLTLVAAAYNAGIGAVSAHDGVPPYPETQHYVAKVHALHARYRSALGLPAPVGSERPALPAAE